jgi:hypothetical protein
MSEYSLKKGAIAFMHTLVPQGAGMASGSKLVKGASLDPVG